MSVVLDTSVLVEHLRGDPAAREGLVSATEGDRLLFVSEVSRIELVAGGQARQERRLQRLFEAVEWMPVDERISRAAGALMRRFGRGHSGIDLADYVIAATAQTLEAELWTLNVRHFPMFPRLRPPF